MKMGCVTVNTAKMEESIEFYTRIMGFKVKRSFSPRPDMTITFLKDDSDVLLEFISGEGIEAYQGKGLSLTFDVKDINHAHKHLKNHNVEITFGPMEMPNGVKLLNAKDINGLELGFIEEPK